MNRNPLRPPTASTSLPPRHLARTLVLVVLGSLVSGCANSPPPEAIPLTPEELEFEKAVASYGQSPTDDAGKAELILELDQTLSLWHAAVLDSNDARQVQLTQNLEAVLQKKVYNNFDIVLDMLQKGDERQRSIAAAAIGFSRLKEPPDPAALASFEKTNPPKYKRAIGPLINSLRADDFYLVNNALLGLAQIGDPTTPLDPILSRLNTESEEIRANAALALSRILTKETAEVALSGVIKALNDPHPKVRLNAIAAARKIGHPDTAGTLARILAEDPYLEVQRNAAFALASIGDPRNGLHLVRRLSELLTTTLGGRQRQLSELDARRRHLGSGVIAALEILSNEHYGDDLEDWQDWWSDQAAS